MATFSQNITKIRGGAILGSEMRTAIAEAIEQASETQYDSQSVPYPDTENVYIRLIPNPIGSGNYTLEISRMETNEA